MRGMYCSITWRVSRSVPRIGAIADIHDKQGRTATLRQASNAFGIALQSIWKYVLGICEQAILRVNYISTMYAASNGGSVSFNTGRCVTDARPTDDIELESSLQELALNLGGNAVETDVAVRVDGLRRHFLVNSFRIE